MATALTMPQTTLQPSWQQQQQQQQQAPLPNIAPIHHPALFSSSFARTYSARTGGCNILLATHLISLIKPHLPPPHSPLRILDNASGPMVSTLQCLADPTISTSYPSLHISAVDLSPDFVTANEALIAENPAWNAGASSVDTAVMNGMDLSAFPDDTFDVSFTGLAIFAFPDPVLGASELHRTLKSGGVAALTTWKNVGWVPLLQQAEEIIRPGKEETRFPMLEAWEGDGKLESVLREGGFKDVKEGVCEGYAWWGGVQEAAEMLCQTLKMLVGGAWSAEEKERMGVVMGEVMERNLGGLVRVEGEGEGTRVGIEMVAWTGVGRKV